MRIGEEQVKLVLVWRRGGGMSESATREWGEDEEYVGGEKEEWVGGRGRNA